jgi:hypothetical protein
VNCEVVKGGGDASVHSFITGISGSVSFSELLVGPLSFAGDLSSLFLVGNGTTLTITFSNFTSISSASNSALIVSDNSNETQGSVVVIIIGSTFSNLV